MMGVLIIENINLKKDFDLASSTSHEFMEILESQEEIVPKIFVGEEYLFGEEFNYSSFLKLSLENEFIERYLPYVGEVISFLKFQVYFLNEDPQLFESCLLAIHDFKESQDSGKYLVPYIAWKGKYIDYPMASNFFEEPTKYDNMEVWAITILDFRRLSIETTYFVNSETVEQLPFVITTN
jgi:hypothetical protein